MRARPVLVLLNIHKNVKQFCEDGFIKLLIVFFIRMVFLNYMYMYITSLNHKFIATA